MLLVALEMLLEMPDSRPLGCSALEWADAAAAGLFSFFLETAFPFSIW
ncbi:MAG TPA: hypothetical protein P5051_03495 [Methanothrix sp.]|nr:hypothetical protein [Methanothrix sp.]